MPALSSVVRGTGFYGRMISLMFQSFTGKHNPGQRLEYAIGPPTKSRLAPGFTLLEALAEVIILDGSFMVSFSPPTAF